MGVDTVPPWLCYGGGAVFALLTAMVPGAGRLGSVGYLTDAWYAHVMGVGFGVLVVMGS